MRFQRRISNGSWVDCSEKFVKENTDEDLKEIIEKLKNGGDVYYDTEFYAKLRIKPNLEEREKKIRDAKIESLKTQKRLDKEHQEHVGKYERW
jgi:Ca2+-dependent lipid-binding protein